MKRKGRRLLALVLALVMVFALVSCGNSTTEEAQEDVPVTEEPVVQEEPETEVGEESETGIEEKVESEEAIEEEPEPEEEEDEAIVIGLGDSIETDKFTMRFDSVTISDDFSIQTGEHTKITPSVDEGNQVIVLSGHFESFASDTIGAYHFKISLLANDQYSYDDLNMNFVSNNSMEIDPLEEKDFYIYGAIPDKLVDMLETAEFTIAFNDDLSVISTNWNSDGTSVMDADNFYKVSCIIE